MKAKALKTLLPAILISAITLAAFMPSLKNDFVNWDDNEYVTTNTVIQNPSAQNIAQVFSGLYLCTYLPVTMMSYMLDHQLFRLDPFGYHLTNLIFHLLNSLLVLWLIRSFSRSVWVAMIAAILFGIHPLHVESVAWISERKDVLYSFFLLLSMIFYIDHLKNQRMSKTYWFSLVFFVLALLSKAMAITLPFLLCLVDYVKERRFDRKAIADKIPFLALAVCFGIVGAYGQCVGTRVQDGGGFFNKFLIAAYAIAFYTGKILWPSGLSCLYPYSGIQNASIYWLSLAGCFGMLLGVIRTAKRTRKIAFGVLFFLITLLPVLQFVPIGSTIVADRYVYMASIGLFYLAGEGVAWAYKKLAERGRSLSVVLIPSLLILIVAGLFVSTWKRCAVWKDGITLWSDALGKQPSQVAYVNRGVLYASRKEYDKALSDFLKLPEQGAVTRYPFLGKLYLETGQTDQAIAVFEQSLKMGVGAGWAYFNLANIYSGLGKDDVAASFYEKAIEWDPGYVDAYYERGLLYKKMGKKNDALMMLRRALEKGPNVLLVYRQLSRLFEEEGRKAEQIALFRQAIARDVPFYDAYYDIGNLDVERGDTGSALRMFRKAVEINPASAEGYASLGSVYCAMGQTKKAISQLIRALNIDPKSGTAHNNIAVAYYYQKQYALAIQHCDQAMSLGYAVTPQLLELLKPFREQLLGDFRKR